MIDDELLAFIKQTKVTKEIISSNITHPILEKRYPGRTIFVLLRKYAIDFLEMGSEPRFIGIAGLRGVGKTTTMWQVTEKIFDDYKGNVYFFNVNTVMNLGYTLQGTLQMFQKIVLKKRFVEYKTPIVLLFDEVHDDPSWAKTMKILYDEAKTAFILSTGSSALLLQQTADLSRRMKIEKLYPFRFFEFITARSFYSKESSRIFPQRGLSQNLREHLFFSPDFNNLVSNLKLLEGQVDEYYDKVKKTFSNEKVEELKVEYIKYHNIPAYLAYKEKGTILNSVLSLFSRIIYEDIRKMAPDFKYQEQTIKLLVRLAGSDEINYEGLSKILGIPKNTIDAIIDLLNKAEIINLILPYGGIDTRVAKNKKAFFMSPSLRLALLTAVFGKERQEKYLGKLYEDIVVMYLNKSISNGFLSFVPQVGKGNADFILETGEAPIILEIGVGKRRINQISLSRIKYRYGILISDAVESVEAINEDKIIRLPLSWFLLS